MIIKKTRFFYIFLIFVLYLNSFETLIRGALRQAFFLEFAFTSLANFIIYVLPLFLAFMGAVDHRFLLVLGWLIFLIVLFPFRLYGDAVSYFLAFRSFVFLLFYLPIIKYVLKFEGFDRKIFRHILVILWLFVIWGALELLSSIYYPDMALLMKTFAITQEQAQTVSRPLGMAMDYQTGAFSVALLCLICLFQGRYVVYGMLLILSGYLEMKTWFLAAVITSALTFLSRFNIRYMLVFALVGVLIFAGLLETLNYVAAGKSGSAKIMLDLFLRDQIFLLNQTGIIIPNGLVRFGGSSLADVGTVGLPEQFAVTEIAILRILFQLGYVGTIWWLYVIYAPLIHKWYNFYKNDYLMLLFYSTVGFIHHETILKPFIFVMLLFFGLQANKIRLEKK